MFRSGPIVTLLTDFGDRDYFVGSMKGVLLSVNPGMTIIDLSHQIPPHAVEQAAYVLASCYRFFPDGTVHIAVVDPGVGTARRALLVTTSRHLFLAPDNGLLTHVLQEERDVRVRAIDERHRRKAEGPTFDGRDLFAPVAALLTTGQPADSFGPVIQDPIQLPKAAPYREGDALIGRIVYVDRFGNLISNIGRRDLDQAFGVTQRTVRIIIGPATIVGLVSSYAEGDSHRPHALINSNGFLEIFTKEGSAAESLKLGVGVQILISSKQ